MHIHIQTCCKLNMFSFNLACHLLDIELDDDPDRPGVLGGVEPLVELLPLDGGGHTTEDQPGHLEGHVVHGARHAVAPGVLVCKDKGLLGIAWYIFLLSLIHI